MVTTTSNTKQLQRLLAIGKLIGNTPVFQVQSVFSKPRVRIFAKLEWQQLSGSVKARAAYNIIRNAIYSGELNGKTLIDASSGNTAVAYATIGTAIGIPIAICLPENASSQKINTLKALGAELIFTSKYGTTDEAQAKARALADERPDLYYYADQYANDANWQAHYNGTALEILGQTDGLITHFVSCLGTTGTFMGNGRRLREAKPSVKLVSLQPDNALHGLEGWKHLETAKVPKIYSPGLTDENLFIDTLAAYDMMREVAKHEGLLLSPSSAANLVGAIQVAEHLDSGVVVTTFADHASNYPEMMKEIFA
jgi:S-sulfo-L-cysteine synthase (O-acetyl-L-serine-dependent)